MTEFKFTPSKYDRWQKKPAKEVAKVALKGTNIEMVVEGSNKPESSPLKPLIEKAWENLPRGLRGLTSFDGQKLTLVVRETNTTMFRTSGKEDETAAGGYRVTNEVYLPVEPTSAAHRRIFGQVGLNLNSKDSSTQKTEPTPAQLEQQQQLALNYLVAHEAFHALGQFSEVFEQLFIKGFSQDEITTILQPFIRKNRQFVKAAQAYEVLATTLADQASKFPKIYSGQTNWLESNGVSENMCDLFALYMVAGEHALTEVLTGKYQAAQQKYQKYQALSPVTKWWRRNINGERPLAKPTWPSQVLDPKVFDRRETYHLTQEEKQQAAALVREIKKIADILSRLG
jgi:hypothetical protein